MTRTKPAEQRRAELLAAGQALFLADGIAATSLGDITQRAGVSKGLFYLYFHSKEDLVLALQEQFSRQFAARMRAAADGQADWTAKLDACVQASFEGYRDLHDLHEVLFHHAASAGHAASAAHAAHAAHAASASDAGHAIGPGHAVPASRPASPDSGSAPAHAVAEVIQDLFAAGTAAGVFDVADPGSTAVLCYASMHALDRGVRGLDGPDDARLVRAAQQLFRRAAGVA